MTGRRDDPVDDQAAPRPRRFVPDPSWQRHDRTVLAGSPLRIFRLGAAGVTLVERLEAGSALAADEEATILVQRLLDAGAIHPVVLGTRSPDGRSGDSTVTVVTPQLGGTVHLDGRVTVDDGSDPPLAGATFRLTQNRGPAAARNATRAIVDTALVAFLDADVHAEPGWFEPLLAHFDDPAVGLVAPRVTGEARSPLDLGDEPARIRSGTRVSYVPGAALVVRRAALDAVGWFDETLRFGEDVDLVWRLDEMGWRCRYDPSVTVWHRPRDTWPARLRQHADYGTSAAPLALRHPHSLAPMRSNGWTAAVWVLATATLAPVPSLVLAVASAAALPRQLPELPRRVAVSLALRGHALGGKQLAEAVRRAWWPVVAVAALRSNRARAVLIASLLAAPRSAATDAAYGWGLWTGMIRHRTIAPVLPRISAWPGRRPSTGRHGATTAVDVRAVRSST